ncbi:hypothetical protein GQR58_004776 [Nymphon striatum]|nr:hypothetical protein GQR58_004776 [Nymphon striatum]
MKELLLRFVFSGGNIKRPEFDYTRLRKVHKVSTKHCGDLTVHVQGDASHIGSSSAVFLTVHDMGSNHADFFPFLGHGSMKKIVEKSVFLHVDLPGQSNNESALSDDFKYPSLQQLGEDLISVVDHFKVKLVVGLGEGCGANILARFGMTHPDKILGLLLIHCTSTTAGIMEYFNDKVIKRRLSNVGMNPSADQYLVFHKYGSELEKAGSSEGREKLIKDYIDILHEKINAKNLRLLVDAFLNRTDISAILKDTLKVDCLLITGLKASHLHTVDTMYNHMDHTKTQLMKISDVGDVLHEAPEKLAQSLLLFVQGLGLCKY